MISAEHKIPFAAVVLYECEPSESSALRSLASTALSGRFSAPVVVIDNSPLIKYDQSTTAIAFPSLSITWIHNPHNPGLAFAYNQAAKVASERGAEWLLVLDQDTCIDPSFISSFQRSAAEMVDMLVPRVKSRGAIISPFPTLLGRKRNGGLPIGVPLAQHPFFAINSGMVIRLAWLEALGGYDRRFWVYGVDSWICRMLVKTGGKVLVMDTMIEHDLSEQTLDGNDARISRHAQYLEASRLLYAGATLENIADACLQLVAATARAVKTGDSRFISNVFRRRIFR